MTATLITVAVTESRMMNLENDFCRLKAIRRAMKDEMFTIKSYSAFVYREPNPGYMRLCSIEQAERIDGAGMARDLQLVLCDKNNPSL